MYRRGLFVCAAAFAASGLRAEVPSAADPIMPAPIIGTTTADEAFRGVIPALTPVALQIDTPVGSKLSKSGDMFPIRLAQPIMVGDKIAVPAGARGQGEVVHAKKGGGGGVGGELVLAARYLEVDGRHLNLRSMALVSLGRDRVHTANAVAIAAGVLSMLFVGGGNTELPSGTPADAKTREDFRLGPAEQLPTPDAEDVSKQEG